MNILIKKWYIIIIILLLFYICYLICHFTVIRMIISCLAIQCCWCRQWRTHGEGHRRSRRVIRGDEVRLFGRTERRCECALVFVVGMIACALELSRKAFEFGCIYGYAAPVELHDVHAVIARFCRHTTQSAELVTVNDACGVMSSCDTHR